MPQQATAFARTISLPNEAWLTKQPREAILDPELPIIDTHQHFWDRPDHRYLLDRSWATSAGLRPVRRQGGRGVFAVWKDAMSELAACPNLVVKLGGMMRRLAAFDYGMAPTPPSSEELAGYWRPYMTTCIELFGADRCLFESNFPVEKVGAGYAVLWNAFKRIAANASPDEKRALFSGTARRVYRLD